MVGDGLASLLAEGVATARTGCRIRLGYRHFARVDPAEGAAERVEYLIVGLVCHELIYVNLHAIAKTAMSNGREFGL